MSGRASAARLTLAAIAASSVLGACIGSGSPPGVAPLSDDGQSARTMAWPLRSPGAAVSPAVPPEMVCVPAGPFTRGYDVPPLNRDEYPKSRVELAVFAVDREEVTVADYRKCVAKGACDAQLAGSTASAVRRPTPTAECNYPLSDRERHPINCVSWIDAYRYCAAVGKRLPTEAEWEKAARGGGADERQAPWGALADVAAGGPRANLADRTAAKARPELDVFPQLDDGFVTTAPVGSFPAGASPYGALDMLGNVAEWVFDLYDPDAYFHSASGAPPKSGGLRVYRGHAWSSTPTIVRITRRSAALPNDRDASTGFRCAADVVKCPELIESR